MGPDDPLKELDIHERHVAKQIGSSWKDLARHRIFGLSEANIENIQTKKGGNNADNVECCIEVLACWIREHGKDATAGKLAEALNEKGFKMVAEKLIGMLRQRNQD